jgi:hypothetical protein
MVGQIWFHVIIMLFDAIVPPAPNGIAHTFPPLKHSHGLSEIDISKYFGASGDFTEKSRHSVR